MKKKSMRIKAALWIGLAVAAVLSIVMFVFWWNSQPAHVFPYWSDEISEEPGQNGLDLSIQVTRNADGSGEVSYFYENHTSEPLGCSTRDIVDTWIDYLYEGGYHKVTGFKGTVSFPASGTSGVEQVRPGDVYSGVKELPKGTLLLSGQYRFCAKDIGWVEFYVENGEVHISE
ncbi:MAG: hypothetical protein ACLU5C_08960 [Acutalibacter sp.]